MPIILTQNDVVKNPAHQWDDVEGVRYHYPSNYRSLITEGEPFIYYRGVYRADGKRAEAEYFGFGKIGKVWADPDKAKSWYCAIDEYQPFAEPVPSKLDGEAIERVRSQNHWRNAVRTIEPSVYDEILRLAGREGAGGSEPNVDEATISSSSDLLVPATIVEPRRDGVLRRTGYRKSKRAKEIGDWAENAVVRYIADIPNTANCVHRAANGETPGWDIDYLDSDGVLQKVEVKGTTGAAFTSIQMTIGELDAARRHRGTYWLFLVAGCFTKTPKVQAICDPAQKIDDGSWSMKAELFSIRFG
jgi:hypothetical protein